MEDSEASRVEVVEAKASRFESRVEIVKAYAAGSDRDRGRLGGGRSSRVEIEEVEASRVGIMEAKASRVKSRSLRLKLRVESRSPKAEAPRVGFCALL